MPRIEFERVDLLLVVDSAKVRVSFRNNTPEEFSLELQEDLARRVLSSEGARAWQSYQSSKNQWEVIRRVIIDIRDSALQVDDWESKLRSSALLVPPLD